MSFPLYDDNLASGLLSGILFGFVLESAGLGSPRKLVSQFTLRDFAVIKVMFTAVVVAAMGLLAIETFGGFERSALYIPPLRLVPILVGGLLIGSGFALGGYCPGTSAAALGSGRVDALVFMAGMVAGGALFYEMEEEVLSALAGGEALKGTADQLTGIPAWMLLVVLAAMAAGLFILGTRLERAHGGPIAAD